MKLATMDIGSGTVRLLLCDQENGRFRRHSVQRRITRLADDFAEGLIHPDSLSRTVNAARDFARDARSFGAVEIRAVCTGVTRRARNASDFLAQLVEQAGLDPVLIAGEFEAKISARGAAVELGFHDRAFLLMDIGGFSTELALVKNGDLEGAVSMEVGAVAMTGRLFRDDPPTPGQLEACAVEVRQAIRQLARLGDLRKYGPLVGTAGTITTLAAIDLKMERYDPERINRSLLTAARVDELLALFVSMPAADRLSLPGMEKGREDLMPAGTIICREVMRHAGADRLLVTEGGVLEGLAVWPEWPPTEGRWLTP